MVFCFIMYNEIKKKKKKKTFLILKHFYNCITFKYNNFLINIIYIII